MNDTSRFPRLGVLGLGAACVACCAVPLASVLAGLGVLSVVASFWMPAMMLLALGTMLGAWALRRRARRVASASDVADLGMPTFQRHGGATGTPAQNHSESEATGSHR